jgi:hypothetical protein
LDLVVSASSPLKRRLWPGPYVRRPAVAEASPPCRTPYYSNSPYLYKGTPAGRWAQNNRELGCPYPQTGGRLGGFNCFWQSVLWFLYRLP